MSEELIIENIKKICPEDGDLIFIKVKDLHSCDLVARALKSLEYYDKTLMFKNILIHCGEIEDIKIIKGDIKNDCSLERFKLESFKKEPIGEDMHD